MTQNVLSRVNLDDPIILENSNCRQAIAVLASQFVHRAHDAIIDELKMEIGPCLKVLPHRIDFFGGFLTVDLLPDGRRQMQLRHINGTTTSLDTLEIVMDNQKPKLPDLTAVLHRAAHECVANRMLMRTRQLAGVDDLSQTEVFFYHTTPLRECDQPGVERLAGEPLNDLVARAEAKIEALFDPGVTRLTRKCSSNPCVGDYNKVVVNKAMARQFVREAQHMLPLIHCAIAAGLIPHMTTDTLKVIKEDFLRHGVTDSGWKLMTRFRIDQMRWLTKNYNYQQIIGVAQLLAETGDIPPMALLRKWLSDRDHRWRSFLPPAWFRRAVLRHARTIPTYQELRQFLDYGDYAHACDWLLANPVTPDANQLKAGWGWIKRASEAWTVQTQLMRGRNNASWTSLLGPYEDSGYRVIPLTSTEALVKEGAAQHHCVGSYDYYCIQGLSRIFSIRQGDKPLVTVEIHLQGTRWTINQAKAFANGQPAAPLMQIAERLAGRYDRAWQRLMQADVNGRPAELTDTA